MPATPARAVVATEHGGAEVLQVREDLVPDPGPGELLVEVLAAGINFIDVYKREGIYATAPPFVLGEELAGRVRAIGSGVAGVEVGDLVATAAARHGALATVRLIDAATTVPIPAGLDPQLACAVLLQGMTAQYLVTSVHRLAAGEYALVHAAAGGVGQLLVQLGRNVGAQVIATVGSADKVAVAAGRGAEHVLRTDELTDTAQLAAAVRELSGGGVHVSYDGVGKATFEASLASLRRRGMLALFGGASGQVPPFDLQRLNAGGSLFATRPKLADYVATREELLARAGAVFREVIEGRLEVAIGGRYPLEDAAQAYRDLESRRSTGKLLIIPSAA